MFPSIGMVWGETRRKRAGTEDDQVRITAQLVDAVAGHHLWAERYDRDVKDIFGVQDEISHAIVIALKEIVTADNGTP